MENPTEMDDVWGYPCFRTQPYLPKVPSVRRLQDFHAEHERLLELQKMPQQLGTCCGDQLKDTKSGEIWYLEAPKFDCHFFRTFSESPTVGFPCLQFPGHEVGDGSGSTQRSHPGADGGWNTISPRVRGWRDPKYLLRWPRKS